ncbi:MAG: peptidoglycan-associated lipoprotein [Rickettsiales bacterium]|jgi:peptidoglycan-associated lipoprotein
MKKLLVLAFIAITTSSCGGAFKQDSVDTQNQYEEPLISQNIQEFDVINSEDAAEEINLQAEEEIEAVSAVEEVEVADRVLFEVNASTLTDDAKKILTNQSAWLKSDPQIKIIIEGHCDDRGAREYNIALGEKRANSTKEYLVSNGIESSRIKTISYGKERPAFVGTGEAIWAKNRRSVTVIEE